MYRVAAVIPNWNGAARLARLLEGLQAQSYPIDRVIVVDNGSTDDSVAVASPRRRHRDRAGRQHRLQPCGKLRNSGCSVRMDPILNNDVLPEPDWLRNLMQTAARRARLVRDREAARRRPPRSRGRRLSTPFAAARAPGGAATGVPTRRSWNQPREIRFAPFTAALFRAELFERVGLLDEDSRVLSGGHRLRNPLRRRWTYRPLRSRGRRLPPRQRHPGTLASGHGPENFPQPVTFSGETLSPQMDLTLWLADFRRPNVMGIHRAYATERSRLPRRQAGRSPPFRKSRGESCANLTAILERSEREIRELQSLTGFDLYWRLYFALT